MVWWNEISLQESTIEMLKQKPPKEKKEKRKILLGVRKRSGKTPPKYIKITACIRYKIRTWPLWSPMAIIVNDKMGFIVYKLDFLSRILFRSKSHITCGYFRSMVK